MLPDRNARLLLESSQARPPGSQASVQNGTAALTDSTVALLSSATVLPSASTSLPPQDQSHGYQKPGGSPNEWANAWPIGRPFALRILPAARSLSQLSGNLS